MKKYLAFFRLHFTMGLQYRVAALAGVATQFAWGFLEILTFHAFYETAPEKFPMSLSATVSYVWLQQAFLAFFVVWMMENDIFQAIIDGNIAYELCRPIHIYNMWFSRSVANRIARAVLRCFPILILAVFLPESYGIGKPSGTDLILFFITLFLGLMVVVAFCMLVYALAFFTISPEGLRILITSGVELLSGALIPIPFFPPGIRRVLEILPFASMQNVPLRIYGGSMSGEEIKRAVLLQVIWLVILIAGGKGLCRLAERKAIVQGG
ncbi:MAG: ABC-2 family transporter protein [Roseburia sp.]|nr:ABC-2 family transporter protein [Roseburia sp.]